MMGSFNWYESHPVISPSFNDPSPFRSFTPAIFSPGGQLPRRYLGGLQRRRRRGVRRSGVGEYAQAARPVGEAVQPGGSLGGSPGRRDSGAGPPGGAHVPQVSFPDTDAQPRTALDELREPRCHRVSLAFAGIACVKPCENQDCRCRQ